MLGEAVAEVEPISARWLVIVEKPEEEIAILIVHVTLVPFWFRVFPWLALVGMVSAAGKQAGGNQGNGQEQNLHEIGEGTDNGTAKWICRPISTKPQAG